MMKQPMLSEYSALEDLPFGLSSSMFVQPKLKGVRATWYPGSKMLRTRGVGQPISAVPHIVADCERIDKPMDGEIYVHTPLVDDTDIAAACNRLRPSDFSSTLQFHVFDLCLPGLDELTRQVRANAITTTDNIKRVETHLIGDRHEARVLYESWLAAGYEGMIARPSDELYAFGVRRTYKVKPVWD